MRKSKKRSTLMLLTRPFSGELSGRKMVLKTAYNFFSSQGDVLVIGISEQTGCADDSKSNFISLPRPGLLHVLINCLHVLFRGWSLNEAIFFSCDNERKILEAVGCKKFDYVYVDSVRMMPYLNRLDLSPETKVVLDFDDIYSDRYQALLEHCNGETDLLGFYGSGMALPIRKIIGRLSGLILKFEASRMLKRELFYSEAVNSRVIVSPLEAKVLFSRTGLFVNDIAMTVPDHASIWQVDINRPDTNHYEVSLIGNFDYLPNRQSLLYIRDSIVPFFGVKGKTIRVNVIGRVSADFSAEFDQGAFCFMGFVESLPSAISGSCCLLSPIVSGTGIKTKIIEAFSLGIPVVTNAKGIEGIDVRDSHHVLLADSPETFYLKVVSLYDSPELAKLIASNAYQYYKAHFSESIIYNKWLSMLNHVE